MQASWHARTQRAYPCWHAPQTVANNLHGCRDFVTGFRKRKQKRRQEAIKCGCVCWGGALQAGGAQRAGHSAALQVPHSRPVADKT